jgi:AraC-like DNA-binding protein
MQDNLTNSNIALSMLVKSAQALGLPVEDMLTTFPQGITEQSSETVRYSADKVPLIWQWLVAHSDDSNIGFRLALQQALTSQSMLMFLFMSSKTLRDGIDKIIEYRHLIGEGIQFDLHINNGDCFIEFQLNADENISIRQQDEYFVLLTHSWLKQLMAAQWSLKEVHFKHAQPDNITEHKALLACEVLFQAEKSTIVFDANLLQLPIIFANDSVNQLHEQQAQHLLTELNKGKLVNRVSHSIEKHLAKYLEKNSTPADITITLIAADLSLSERQLKSQLAYLGSNFSVLLDTVRKNKALELLNIPQMKIADIADACGFAESSTFNRAFKRWYGQNPSEYRLEMQTQG